MRKRSFLTVIGLLVSMLMMATTISKDEAKQKALQFIKDKVGNTAARSIRPIELKLNEEVGTEDLYAFNIEGKNGFIIVSADDCVGDMILGYADQGEIIAENMPSNMRSWLQGYADQIQWMKEHGIQQDEAAARTNRAAAKTPISPLLSCNWNQAEPYNNNCPDVLSGDNVVRAASGCLATAGSQVMYWHQKKYGEETGIWTTTTDSIPAYESNHCPIVTWTNEAHTKYTTGNTVGAKAPTTIDWSKLVDNYPDTDEANAEVAKLMEYVGAGLKMQYGPESSAIFAYFAPMLINYFGYNKSARFVERAHYSYDEWLDLMYDQIMNVGPVFYGAQSTGGGHAFVLDGYEEEDYFHVNWGWGGGSNGYFKLSVLYPQQQGIGGSKSQDGFNFQQNATIDVNPDKKAGDQNSTIRMTAYGIWADTTSLHRASRNANFVMKRPYFVHFRIFNMTGETHNMDLGLGLYKGNTLIKVLSSGSVDNIPNYNGWDDKTFSFSFGAGMADDEYKIVTISRKKNSKTWYQNYCSEEHYIKAVISDTTLTLTPMGDIDLNVSLAVTDNPTMNQPVTVTATVTNNGPLYSGDLLLAKGTHKNDEVTLCAQQVEIEQGETATVDFTFTPKNSGDMTIYLLNKYWATVSKDLSLAIAPSTLTTGTLELNYKTDYTLSEGSFRSGIYGSTISGTVKVTNTANVDHTSGLVIKLYQLYDNNNSSLVDQMTTYEPIEKNSSKEIPFKLTNMVPGGKYFINLFYKTTDEFIAYSYNFKSNLGVITYTADGAFKSVAPTASVVVPDSVVALDISGADNVTTVTPNNTPNTLYIVSGSVPNGLKGKNVVLDGAAASLTLSDGFDFYPTIDFFVTEAPSFTKKFTLAGDGKNGWTTIVLPFDVKQVKQGDKVIDWFHSESEEGKDFWVKSFASENDSTVYFAFANEMKANIPYLISVPENLTNKDITFYGEANTDISKYKSASATNKIFKFSGSTCGETVTNKYVLNNNGTAFVKASATIPAFQAYFMPWKTTKESVLWLYIGSEEKTTVISVPVVASQADQKGIYNLNGQRVKQPKKGIYIVNGKKVVVK